MSLSIILYRGTQFTSPFRGLPKKGLGTKVKHSINFHPQTDYQAECTIQTLDDMLRAYVIDFMGNWDDHLPLIEFSYNNSYHSIISMAPFKAIHGRSCRSLAALFEVGEFSLLGIEIFYEAMEKVRRIGDRLKILCRQ